MKMRSDQLDLFYAHVQECLPGRLNKLQFSE